MSVIIEWSGSAGPWRAEYNEEGGHTDIVSGNEEIVGEVYAPAGRNSRNILDYDARAIAEVPAMVQGYRDLVLSLECAAGCDEGVSEDVAATEILSAMGSAVAVAYCNARAILARIDGQA